MARARSSFRLFSPSTIAFAWILSVLLWFELRTWPGFVSALAELAVPVQWAGMAGLAHEWAGRTGGLVVFVLLQISCLGAGTAAARLLRLHPRPWRDLPLGWLAMGTAFAGTALAGLAFPAVLALLAVAPLAAVRWGDLRPVRGKGRKGRDNESPQFLPLLAVSAAVLAVVLLVGLAPETEGDPLTCHYANPLRILGLHRMTAWPFSIHDDYPFLYESLLLPLFGAGGEQAVRWFNPLLLALLSALAYRAGARFMGRGWAMVGAGLVATNPFLASQAVVGKNDLMMAVFGLAAIQAVAESRSGRSLVAAGLLCGGAFAVKYNGAYLVPALAVCAIFAGGAKPKLAVLLLPGAVLGALPVLAKNFLLTGDPLYPFLGAVFGGPFTSAISRARLREHLFVLTGQDPSVIGPGMAVRSLTGAGASPDESLGRWFLLLPLLLGVRRLVPEARVHLYALAVLAAAWAMGPPHARYAAVLFPSGYILVAYGFSAWYPGARRVALVLAWALLLGQAVHAVASAPIARLVRAGLGLEDERAYRMRRLGPVWGARQAVGREPGARRVLLLGDNRSALLDIPADFAAFGGPAFPPYGIIAASRTVDEVVKRVHQSGWTQVIYNRLSAFFWSRSLADDPWTERDLALWGDFWARHAEPVYESPKMDLERGYYYVYRLVDAPRARSFAVLPGVEGWVWRMEQARASGNRGELASLLASLKRAAGSYGITDRVEADMSGPGESREKVRSLLLRAVARGFRSPPVFLHLAALAAEGGDSAGAARWKEEAEALEPGSSRR